MTTQEVEAEERAARERVLYGVSMAAHAFMVAGYFYGCASEAADDGNDDHAGYCCQLARDWTARGFERAAEGL
jgi:hypothetical protein